MAFQKSAIVFLSEKIYSYTVSLHPVYTYSARAFTAGVDVMEKGFYLFSDMIGFGKLSCIHTLTGCVL